jgi:hypothetical protein
MLQGRLAATEGQLSGATMTVYFWPGPDVREPQLLAFQCERQA